MTDILPERCSTMPFADMTPHTSWFAPNCPASSVEDGEISRPHRHTIAARSLSYSHPTAAQLQSMRRRSSATSSAMVSLEDYEHLPASIKRKLFSSNERLSVAPQSTKKHRRRKLSIGQASIKPTTHDDLPRPATSGGISNRYSRRMSKVPTPTFPDITNNDITVEQAHWYISLPDKIRKQQFTRREQVTFALQCKRALENTAPDYAQDALRRCLNLGRDEDAAPIAREKNRQPSTDTVDTDILLPDHANRASFAEQRSDSLLDGVDPIEHIVVIPPPDVYLDPTLRASKSMVDVSLPPSSSHSSTPSTLRRRSNSISFRRKSHGHLTPLPLPPPQLAPAPPLPQLPPAFSTMQRDASFISLQSDTVEPKTLLTDFRPESKLHHQPDVRKQLRQWLTPEKFDEALEFGFAFPNADSAPPSPPDSQYSLQQPPPLTHTDDEYSEEGGRDSSDNSGPMTPTTAPEQLFLTGKKPSFDSTGDLSFRSSPFSLFNRSRKHGPVEPPAEREMTVRVTLTRRGLRAPGDSDYGAGRFETPAIVDVERVDPLALEAISVCDDPTGAHGAFAVSTTTAPRGLKKVWRALRRH